MVKKLGRALIQGFPDKAVELQRTTSQHTYAVEGNNWVDRNKKGQAQAIFEIGWHLKAGRSFPAGPYTSVFTSSASSASFRASLSVTPITTTW